MTTQYNITENWGTILSAIITLVVVTIMGKAVINLPEPSHSSISGPVFPHEAKNDIQFCKHMYDLEKVMGRSLTQQEVSERWGKWKKLRYRPKTDEERRVAHEIKYGTSVLPERETGLRHSDIPGRLKEYPEW